MKRIKLNIQIFATPFIEFKPLPNRTTPANVENVNEMQKLIAGILGVDNLTWDSTKTYALDNIVYYNAKLYINITGTSTSTNPASDTTNWEEISLLK